MVPYIPEKWKGVSQMVKEKPFLRMATFTKGNTWKVKEKDSEFTPFRMANDMKDNGIKTSSMVTESTILWIITVTTVCGFRIISMVRVRCITTMEISMWGIGWTINVKVKVPIPGETVPNTSVTGKMIRKMVKAYWYGTMGVNMMATGRMTFVRAKGPLNIPTVKNT